MCDFVECIWHQLPCAVACNRSTLLPRPPSHSTFLIPNGHVADVDKHKSSCEEIDKKLIIWISLTLQMSTEDVTISSYNWGYKKCGNALKHLLFRASSSQHRIHYVLAVLCVQGVLTYIQLLCSFSPQVFITPHMYCKSLRFLSCEHHLKPFY